MPNEPGHHPKETDVAASNANPAADQLIEVAAIAGGLAHEVRNALSTLRVGLQLLDEDWRDLDDADEASPSDVREAARRGRKRVETLLKESGRLETILNDFLEFVRKRELNLSTLDLNELAADVAEFFQPQAQRLKIAMSVDRCDSALVCRLDASLVKQALLNVLINAQQAMDNGGTLRIALSLERDSTARLDIIDSGPGIEPETLARIFEAYYSTKRGGSGLGLAMTRRIVRAHGGSVRAHSAPGEGTRFSFRFPLAGADL